MFKIHTCDGLTTRLDLDDEEQAAEWISRLKDANYQKKITGVSIVKKCQGKFRCPTCGKKVQHVECYNCKQSLDEALCSTGTQYSLSRPEGSEAVFYLLENVKPDLDAKLRGGERLTCFSDGVKLSMMVHVCQSAARITLSKTGKQRYNPYMD